MNPDSPRISVIIPCRNMGGFVVEAIESALAQTLAPHEVIVIDDASDDDTFDRLQALGPRIHLIRGPGQGSAVARNLGLLAATGDWFAFLDADDLWYPTKLEKQFADLFAKDADASYTDYRRGRTLAEAGPPMLEGASDPCEGAIFPALLRRNFLLTSSIVVKRQILARCGIFKPALKGGQDIDLWLRVARIARFARSREPLTFYRRHGGNITASQKYSYYHAKRWEAVYHEHSDLDDSERAYIRGRWSEALYIAGRRAWWREEFGLARQCFSEMQLAGGINRYCLFWRAVLLLPDAVLSNVRLGKKRLVPDDDDRLQEMSEPTIAAVLNDNSSERR